MAQQFLGMIGGQLLWPQLVQPDFIPPGPVDTAVVDEAVTLMVTRYGACVADQNRTSEQERV